MSAVSSTYSSTLVYALIEERHFALLVGLRFYLGSLLNRSGQELGPTQPSLRSPTAIKIRLFELPYLLGVGCPIITSVIYLLTIEMSGLSRVRTELLRLAVVAALTPHPVQMHGQLPRHRYFRDSSPHGEMKTCRHSC